MSANGHETNGQPDAYTDLPKSAEEALVYIAERRDLIDGGDDALAAWLIERREYCREIGLAKAMYDIEPQDRQREEEKLERIKERTSELGGSSEEIEEAKIILRFLMGNAVNGHKEIRQNLVQLLAARRPDIQT